MCLVKKENFTEYYLQNAAVNRTIYLTDHFWLFSGGNELSFIYPVISKRKKSLCVGSTNPSPFAKEKKNHHSSQINPSVHLETINGRDIFVCWCRYAEAQEMMGAREHKKKKGLLLTNGPGTCWWKNKDQLSLHWLNELLVDFIPINVCRPFRMRNVPLSLEVWSWKIKK